MKDLIKTHSISRFCSLKDLLFWLRGVRPSLPEPIIKLMCHSEHEFLLSEQFSCNLCLSLQGLVFPFSGGSKIERFLWYAEPATLKCDTAIFKTEMPWDLGTVLGNPGNELGTMQGVTSGVTAFWASPRFGHPLSQIPSVLGIPFSYYCSVLGIPRYPPGMPKSLVFWASPPKKMLDFAGKSKTF